MCDYNIDIQLNQLEKKMVLKTAYFLPPKEKNQNKLLWQHNSTK